MTLLQPDDALVAGTRYSLRIEGFFIGSNGLQWIQILLCGKLFSQKLRIKSEA